ncbi:MAG TPA: hypothetical protein P5560_14110 [Thermotogota bacterium]|nr:hypothetical protein [Thermotogota bacterium]HRW94083.1 hypothetical protein [Thermotogota bacterium]
MRVDEVLQAILEKDPRKVTQFLAFVSQDLFAKMNALDRKVESIQEDLHNGWRTHLIDEMVSRQQETLDSLVTQQFQLRLKRKETVQKVLLTLLGTGGLVLYLLERFF